MKDRIYYAIEYFVGAPIEIASKDSEEILFVTKEGEDGIIKKNLQGDWGIYLEGKLIYEIESEFFERTFCDAIKNASEYYFSLKDIDSHLFQEKTRVFLDSLIASTEYLILFSPVVIPDKEVVIGPFSVGNFGGCKNITCLN